MKARPCEAALGGVQNFSAPIGLALWINLPHVVPGQNAYGLQQR